MMVATACWLSVLSIVANIGPLVDLVVNIVVPGDVKLLLCLMASQKLSQMSIIWVLMAQVL